MFSICRQMKTCERSNIVKFLSRFKSYYITSPIFYVNGSPHIGHLYTVLLADAQTRFQRLKGLEAFFATGTDEHGLKIQQAAEKSSISPMEFCNQVSSTFSSTFQQFSVDHSDFIRTTEARHAKAVTKLWNSLVEKDFIYKDIYESWYCIQDESFLTDLQVETRPDGQRVSKESGHPVEWAEEENYVFRLTAFKERLNNWLTNNEIIKPKIFFNHMMQTLKEDRDLSVSRSRSRLQWGIPVPNDPSQTIYVWLDALANYLTVAGYPDDLNENLWPPDCQVVGKDILKFHAMYWPAFLMAAELPLPKQILCHSHWTVDNEKMSKSKGNVICPNDMAQKFTHDGLRYFLLREGTPHCDGNFSYTKLTNYLNAELANTLGNFLNRSTSKAVNLDQVFYDHNQSFFDQYCTEEGKDLLATLEALPPAVSQHFENFDYYLGIDLIMEALRRGNTYVQNEQPWVLKNTDKNHLQVVLNISLETLRVCGILLQPIVPYTSNQLLNKLNIPTDHRQWGCAEKLNYKGDFEAGFPLSAQNVVLFKRIK